MDTQHLATEILPVQYTALLNHSLEGLKRILALAETGSATHSNA